MNSDEERTPRDVQFARRAGTRSAQQLFEWPITPDDWLNPQSSDRSLTLFSEILGEVRTYLGEPLPDILEGSLDETTRDFRKDVDSTFRHISFARDAELGGLVAVGEEWSGLDDPLLVDLSNLRALRTLFEGEGDLTSLLGSGDRGDLLKRARRIVARSEAVTVVNEYDGVKGFLTSFVDSLRAALKALTFSGNPWVQFTVTRAKTRGYALEYYPQYQYSPQAFGSRPTWPVSATIKTNHYRFQGYLNGQLAKDPRTHFAGPNSTTTHLTI